MTRIRKGHLRTSALIAIAAVVVTALAPGRVAAQAEYDFILVEAFDPNFDLREVYLRDINEAGVACGTSTYGSTYAGFVWSELTGKTMIPITWTRGLNDVNQVVGDDRVYNTVNGQSTAVPPAGGWPLTRVHGINDNGIAVGFAECSCSNSDRTAQSALIWDALNGSRATGVLAARELLRINNDNVAVGNIRPSAGSSEAFVYDVDTGVHTNLSDLLPNPPFGRPWSEGVDINGGGMVCGQAYDGNTVPGMVWSPVEGFTYLPGLDGGDPTRVHPLGINDQGVVVGRALSGATRDWDAFIWDPVNGMRNLDPLVNAPGAFTLDWAVEINEQGWIVGIGHFGPGWGTSRGFVLKPLQTTDVPERVASGGLELRLSPNPAVTNLGIEWSALADAGARLRIFDAGGRVVANLFGSDRAPVERGRLLWTVPARLPAGVYFARLESRSGGLTRRFVIVR